MVYIQHFFAILELWKLPWDHAKYSTLPVSSLRKGYEASSHRQPVAIYDTENNNALALRLKEADNISIFQLSTLPSQIAYNNSLSISINAANENEPQSSFSVPRREMFDIRAQLMAEDDSDANENNELISGLEEGDIKPSVYEGGFKTWECAIDLARLVSSEYSSFILSEAEDGKEEELCVIEVSSYDSLYPLYTSRLYIWKNVIAYGKIK